jgi:hypothetical protein
MVGEHQPGVLPVFRGCAALIGLAAGPGAQRLDCCCGEAEGAAGSFGLGLAVGADRAPHGHVRRHCGSGGRVAVQVDVRPVQGAGFFGADPGQQAERDVGVHQFGRTADVFEAGPQLHHRQGAGGGDDRGCLVERQGLRRPALLAFGRVGQGGDVAGHQVVGFGMPDRALLDSPPRQFPGPFVSKVLPSTPGTPARSVPSS